MTPSEIAYAAADRVDRGWCQGDFRNAEGNCCVVHAILVCSGSSFNPRASDIVRSELQAVTGMVDYDFNDTPGRQASEVSAALREAGRRLKERGL